MQVINITDRFKIQINGRGHAYFLDDKPMIGNTTALGVIAKPFLIQWAADVAAANAIGIVPEYESVMAIKDAKEKKKAKDALDEKYPKFKEARTAHMKKKEAGGDWGKIVHKAIEMWISSGSIPLEVECDGEMYKVEEGHMNAINHFVKWSQDNNVKFLESEKRVYSEKNWFAGTLDLVFEMDGKRWIGDIKTSGAIYNEHFFQMGGYEICLEEMGEGNVDGYLVINLKKDGTMDLKMAENREVNKEAFKHALELHKIISTLE